MFEGSHPMPSDANVIVTKQIVDLSEKLDADDLVLVIVSGGGSSLLCWPQTECEQSQRLYQDFIKTNGTIRELNTLRKHISHVKGGGLAKILYPATIVGLVFSDVPGDGYDIVASGPTYFDATTMSDAQAIADRYGLKGYHFEETPKDGAIFKKVTNIPIVSNQTALIAMQKKARDLGYSAHIISDEIYDTPEQVVEKMFAVEDIDVILAGGEPSLEVPANAGKGGRNQHLALVAADHMKKYGICQRTFVALASDGRDNTDAAGAIVNEKTLAKAREQKLDIAEYLNAFNSYEFFKKTGDAIMTGHTDANVSDLMILLNK
jgi:glycerate-2-kinase